MEYLILIQRGTNYLKSYDDYGYDSNSNGPFEILFFWLIISVILISIIKVRVQNHFSDYFFNLIFTIIPALLLTLAPFLNDPGYFKALRWIVSLSIICLLYLSIPYNRNRFTLFLKIALLVIIIIFNPIIPLYIYSRATWFWIDLASIFLIIINTVYSYKFIYINSAERYRVVYDALDSFPEKVSDLIFGSIGKFAKLIGLPKFVEKYGEKYGEKISQTFAFIGCLAVLLYVLVLIGWMIYMLFD